jgi:hypothetical protein
VHNIAAIGDRCAAASLPSLDPRIAHDWLLLNGELSPAVLVDPAAGAMLGARSEQRGWAVGLANARSPAGHRIAPPDHRSPNPMTPDPVPERLPTEPRIPPVPAWSGVDTRLVIALAGTALAAYAAIGFCCHPFMIAGAEIDGYVPRAHELHRGGPAGAPNHPFGVPLLLALGLSLGVDPFVGGRLLAATGGAALVAATYGLLRLYVFRPAALLAAGAVACGELTFTNAAVASSDAPAAGVLACALYCWARVARQGVTRLLPVLAGGLLLGIAMAMRYPSTFALPALLPLLLPGPWIRRGLTALAATGGILVGVLPHLVANARAYGSPFYQDRWHNLMFKYQHNFDLRATFLQGADPWTLFAAHWNEWLLRGLGDVAWLFGEGLFSVFAPQAPSILSIPGSLALSVALLWSVAHRDRAARVLALAALSCAVMTALTFIPKGRFLLPILPACTVLLLARIHDLWPSGRPALAVSGLGFAFAMWSAPEALSRFEGLHANVEVAAARAVATAFDGLCTVQLPVWVEDAAVSAHVVPMPRLPDEQRRTPVELWQHLQRGAADAAVDYVVIGLETAPQLVAALASVPPPGGFEVVRHDEVLVVRCPPADHDWLGKATVQSVEGGWQLLLEFRDDPRLDDMFAAYFFVRDPFQVWHALDLLPETQNTDAPAAASQPRRFARRLPVANMVPAGELLFVPAFLRKSGALLRAAPIRVRHAARSG